MSQEGGAGVVCSFKTEGSGVGRFGAYGVQRRASVGGEGQWRA
jgi:hypothetical protein